MSDNDGTLKQKSISSLIWKLLERGGNAVVQMAVQIVMARLLSPADFGALAIMLVFVNLGNVIVQSGLNTALIQADTVNQDSYSTVYWMSLAASLFLYCVCFIGAPGVAAFYAIPQIIWPLRVLCLVIVVNAYNSVQVAKVTRDLEMRKTCVSTICSVVGSGCLGASIALSGGGLWALVAQQLAYQIINCVTLSLQLDWHPTMVFKLEEAKELFSFGSRLLVSGLLNTGYQSLSDLIVGTFSAESLGIMSQGKKYPTAVANMLDGAVQPVVLSTVSHVSSDLDKARSVVRRGLKSSCFIVMPFMALVACTAPTLVPTMLGPQWAESVSYFQVFCFTSALLPIHSTNLQSLNAMGRSDLFLILEIIKKAYGVASLLFCAFVLKDVWLLCCSYIVTGIVSTLVNALPNKAVLGYGYVDQMRDLAPGVILSIVSYAAAAVVGTVHLDALAIVAMQAIVFSSTYLGLASAFHIEAYEYLTKTAKGMFTDKM